MCSCVEVIQPTHIVKGRKDYRDSCMDYIMEALHYIRRGDFGKLSFSEWRLIAESIRDKWLIKKGDRHEVQKQKSDGEIYSLRSKIGLPRLCEKLNLFECEC